MDEQTPKNDSSIKSILKLKWNTSVVIAFVAVLISSASALISLKESRIMLEQQKILTEQQEASVWPYLQCETLYSFKGDSMVTYQFVITNKGVGPAIIDSVKYVLKGEEISCWGLGVKLEKRYPNLSIIQLGNAGLDGSVLAPGEDHVVITEQIKKPKNDTTWLSEVVHEMGFKLQFCYCSVYGKCWKVEDIDVINPSSSCSFRENIR